MWWSKVKIPTHKLNLLFFGFLTLQCALTNNLITMLYGQNVNWSTGYAVYSDPHTKMYHWLYIVLYTHIHSILFQVKNHNRQSHSKESMKLGISIHPIWKCKFTLCPQIALITFNVIYTKLLVLMKNVLAGDTF